jgi:hypothetical protein
VIEGRAGAALLAILTTLATGSVPAAAQPFTPPPAVTRVPSQGPEGTAVSVSGSGCPQGSVEGVPVELRPHSAAEEGSVFGVAFLRGDGTFATTLVVPTEAPGGPYELLAACSFQDAQVARTSFAVVHAGALRTDGVVRSGPGVAGPGDLFVRGTDDAVYWSREGGPWVYLGAPAGGVRGDPGAVSWAPGRLDLFARGADDKLWQRFSEDGGATWSGWLRPVGTDGVLASGPEVISRGPGRLDVYVGGTDGQVWSRSWGGAGWSPVWRSHGAPPGGMVGEPAAVSWDGFRVDLFVRGADDRLWQMFEFPISTWSQPPGLESGRLASSPGVTSWGPGHLAVVVRGTDGGVYLAEHRGDWGPWRRLGSGSNVIVGAPAATSRGFGRFDVLARGTDDLVYRWTTG